MNLFPPDRRPAHLRAVSETISAALHEGVDRGRPADQRCADTEVADQAARAVLTTTSPAAAAAQAANLPTRVLVAELVARGLLAPLARSRDDGWAAMTVGTDGTAVATGRPATREVTWQLPPVLVRGAGDGADLEALLEHLQDAPADPQER